MLTKLVKYDLLFGLKRYGILFLLLAGIWLSGLVVSLIGNVYLNGFFLIMNILMSLFLVGAYIITSIQFFYNALSNDESYFNYTIPVNTVSLVFSKMAVILMWGAAIAATGVLIWVSLYHTLILPMGMTPSDQVALATAMDLIISIGIAQGVLMSCLLAFSISIFNTPKLKTTNSGMAVVAVVAYLLSQVVGVLQLGGILLWQYISDSEIMKAFWDDSFALGQEQVRVLLDNVQLVIVGSSIVLALLFFWLTVKTVEKHRSV